nr:hypothetical protein [uncultured Shinella sp.]
MFHPKNIEMFRQAVSQHGVKLPLSKSDEDVGTLLDADGVPVLVVDVNRERTDADVAWIVAMVALAVNVCAGFRATDGSTSSTSGGEP